MKILFIIPPNIHYIEPYAYVKADKNNALRPHLGLLYVAAELRRTLRIEPKIIDSNADDLSLENLENIISQEQPDIVGFSVLTFNLLNCMEVSKLIRKCSPKTKICYGGWHPTLYPHETLELGCTDFIVHGEGEESFAELVHAIAKNPEAVGDDFAEIRGIGYIDKNGGISVTSARDKFCDINELPFPAYDLVDTSKYSNLLACSDKSVVIMTSRGCPQRCVFCDMRKTPYRYRRPENIMQEIEHWVKQGVNEFFIQDDNFTIDRKRTIEFCKLLIEADMRISYKISSRVDYLDEELVKYLKKSGCYRIYFGVESGSQRVLDYLEKGITVNKVREAFRITAEQGIDRCAYIMIGSPFEEKEDIDKTLELIKEIRPEHLHCSICTPMPKTRLYIKLMEENIIKHDYWSEFARAPYDDFKTPFISQLFTSDELRRMQNSIQQKFYFDPRVFLREIRKTHNFKQLIMKALMAFRILFR